jgi:hypothetical protein
MGFATYELLMSSLGARREFALAFTLAPALSLAFTTAFLTPGPGILAFLQELRLMRVRAILALRASPGIPHLETGAFSFSIDCGLGIES